MKRKMQMILGTVLVAVMLTTGMALPAWAAPAQKNLILATTTSTQDSGLLDVLNPLFEKKTGYFIKTISVGSGQAMAMGQKGEADVLLVHSPDAEKKFMADGFGVDRLLVMHNDFIVLGPSADPAGSRAPKPLPRPSRRSPRPAHSSCRGATTPEPTPRRRGSGRPRVSAPRDRSGTRRPVSEWGRP